MMRASEITSRLSSLRDEDDQVKRMTLTADEGRVMVDADQRCEGKIVRHVAPRLTDGAGHGVGLKCALCGAWREREASFCATCGAAFIERVGPSLPHTRIGPGIARRALATIIDRLVPLPFIAYLFPPWVVVVLAYNLLSDGTPSGRSVGKRVGRLRVVSVASLEPCGVVRSVIRRVGPALCQLAYCSWEFVWLALLYEFVSLAFVILNPSGRRLEDYLAGTQVITERAYKKVRRACSSCGAAVSTRDHYCTQCGTELSVVRRLVGGSALGDHSRDTNN